MDNLDVLKELQSAERMIEKIEQELDSDDLTMPPGTIVQILDHLDELLRMAAETAPQHAQRIQRIRTKTRNLSYQVWEHRIEDEDEQITPEMDARFDDAFQRLDELVNELLAGCNDNRGEQVSTASALFAVAERTMILVGGPKRTQLHLQHMADKLAKGDFVDPRKEKQN